MVIKPKMTEEEAKDFIKENPSFGRVKIEQATHLTTAVVRRLMKEVRGDYNTRRIQRAAVAKSPALSRGKLHKTLDVAILMKDFDYPGKIREGLALLQEGQVILEQDLRAQLGISTNFWRNAADKEEFDEYKLDVRGKTYWGLPDTLKELEEMMDSV